MSTKSGRQQGVADRAPVRAGRRKGAWPVAEPVRLDEPEQYRGHREAARFHVTLGSIRAELEEQPSPRAVRAAARRWCAAVVQLGGEVAQAKEAR